VEEAKAGRGEEREGCGRGDINKKNAIRKGQSEEDDEEDNVQRLTGEGVNKGSFLGGKQKKEYERGAGLGGSERGRRDRED
ncbi:hypothetical protein ACRTC3_21665, partial [Photobacterium damselae]|uniref:hypothetical protein n=1 Tax=Photobacterium damselae TaxID=38293 RepID=UPI003D7CDFC7